ncbi:MAG: hypothetical protein U0935_14425 [Pirellulales bacterium]
MNCQQLAERIQQLAPHASPRDVARLCLLLTNHVDDLRELQDETRLLQAWTDVSLRLQAATDQHAAMLDELAAHTPSESETTSTLGEQVLTLIRAMRVQGQVLGLYLGAQVVRA